MTILYKNIVYYKVIRISNSLKPPFYPCYISIVVLPITYLYMYHVSNLKINHWHMKIPNPYSTQINCCARTLKRPQWLNHGHIFPFKHNTSCSVINAVWCSPVWLSSVGPAVPRETLRRWSCYCYNVTCVWQTERSGRFEFRLTSWNVRFNCSQSMAWKAPLQNIRLFDIPRTLCSQRTWGIFVEVLRHLLGGCES